MYAEAKGNNLDRVSFLSAGLFVVVLAPSVKYVPAKGEVTQVRFGGAQDQGDVCVCKVWRRRV